MSDIRVVWKPADLVGDWLLAGTTLDTSGELVTAVAVSLLTHATAEGDDVLPYAGADRRGWWADHEAALIWGGTPIGSRLWLLSREKQTEETRLRAEAYCAEALAWMLDTRLAASVDVAARWLAPGVLGADVTITRGDGDTLAVRFEKLWDEVI